MAQAAMHGLLGLTVRKWIPSQKWLALGVVLGNILPDVDNFAVAVAMLAGSSTEGLHRTFTHSLFFVAAIVIAFHVVAGIARRPRWRSLGLGLGAGILMHILLDLLIWFNGVKILWPVPLWVNLWHRVTPPEWWNKLMMATEFLFFALFFLSLERIAHRQGTDQDCLRVLRFLVATQGVLFIVFMVLFYTIGGELMIPYGAFYLLSLGLTIGVIVRMRKTVEALSLPVT